MGAHDDLARVRVKKPEHAPVHLCPLCMGVDGLGEVDTALAMIGCQLRIIDRKNALECID